MRALLGAAVGAAILHLVVPGGVPAQVGAGAPADTGTLIPRVQTGDGDHSYAAFLPPGYDPAVRWPALVLMDPRGRAMVPLGIFRPAAAQLGYVILSSYDTSSDQPTSGEDTRSAVEAVLNDAVARYSLDQRRFYLAGFSGTARIAWSMAVGNGGYFPAILGFGGGLAPPLAAMMLAEGQSSPAFFGGAGAEDFNYAEMWRTDAALDRLGIPHGIMFFPGGHAWPPPEVAAEGLEWVELSAQGAGLAPVDTAWVRARLHHHLGAIRDLARGGRAHDAVIRSRRVIPAFEPFAPLAGDSLEAARRLLAELLESDAVRHATRTLDRWIEWEYGRGPAFEKARQALDGRRPPDAERLARQLDLRELHRQSAGADTVAAQAAARVLAGYMAQASFYLPRQYLAEGDTLRAIRSLELAHRIAPASRAVCARLGSLEPADRARSPSLSEFCAAGEREPGRPAG